MSAIAASLLLLAIFAIAQLWSWDLAGFQSVNQLGAGDTLRIAVLALATVLGVISRGIYDELEQVKSRHVGFRRLIRLASSSKPFWIAILISPILMLAFYESVRNIANDFLVGVMAYQNGFFFRSVLARAEPKEK